MSLMEVMFQTTRHSKNLPLNNTTEREPYNT